MSWTEVDLSSISDEMERLPEGDYVFALLPGAKYNQWNPNKIEVGAKVAEGEYAGRVLYFSYGDPEKTPSMLGAMKRLERALSKSSGKEAEAGQNPIDYLNAVAGAKFVGTVRHRTYTDNNGEEQTKADMALFKIKAAA